MAKKKVLYVLYAIAIFISLILLLNIAIMFSQEVVYSTAKISPHICSVVFVSRDRCFADAGVSSQTVWPCESAGHLKDYCYRETANADNYRQNCEKIQDYETKLICYVGVALDTKNIAICNEIPAQDPSDSVIWKDYCIKNLS